MANEDKCPNCGACKTCGNAPVKFIPYPVYPYYPNPYAQPYRPNPYVRPMYPGTNPYATWQGQTSPNQSTSYGNWQSNTAH